MRASVRQALRRGVALLAAGCTALWWVAVWRLVARPEASGVLEVAIAGGGWGLSLLPVHATPWTRRTTWADVTRMWRHRSPGAVSVRLSDWLSDGWPGRSDRPRR